MNAQHSSYTPLFYEEQSEGSLRSARRVLAHLSDLIKGQSILDVGCGVGTWLAAAREGGASEVLGIDGDYVDRKQLRIPAESFACHDLRQPIRMGRTFDLVLCLEVGEHLPPDSAETLVDCVTAHGSVVVFSAAAPSQTGTDHLNEQWPAYWAEKFRRRGFRALDCLRARLWNDAAVEWWYAQNMILYVQADRLADARLRPLVEVPPTLPVDQDPLPLVHPRAFERVSNELAAARSLASPPHLGPLLRVLPRSVARSIGYRLGIN